MLDPRKYPAVSRLAIGIAAFSLMTGGSLSRPVLAAGPSGTATPIEHIVVIFQENVSFDHYFATYPVALNPPGEPRFEARDDTPSVNGLGTLVEGQPEGVLLTDNPNANNPANGTSAINPFRLDRSQASTCDQDHNYGPEQQAFDMGLMDMFPASVGTGASSFCAATFAYGKGQGLVMGYFDGNTTTALWNYAQNFALNDNSYGTTFGPSTPGLLNLVSGNTFPATPSTPSAKVVPNNAGPGTLVGDLDPTGDVCSGAPTVRLGSTSGPNNIGDLLTAKRVTWGAFMGGFDLTLKNANGTTGCNRSSPATPANGGPTADYIPHHAFFQYFASTANPAHTRPSSVAEIGHAGPANHQYDLHDFFDTLAAGNLPAVSFIKAIAAGDGHAGYSDPLMEQSLTLVPTINAIMRSPFWKSTAVVIMYDDSDGWYDHQMSPIVNPSAVNTGVVNDSDELNGPGVCGHGTPLANASAQPIEGRCGYGPRLPLLVISPFAKTNFVDHSLTDQSSVLRFIEDNWGTGQIGGGSYDQIAGSLANMFDFDDGHHGDGHGFGERKLILDPTTGQPQ
ncbi:MAG TPA: alkaline phosphatase family protein [Stellaceae bacterium]|nr:alkaline phosphatase family protein [Stellaceae bacterium]